MKTIFLNMLSHFFVSNAKKKLLWSKNDIQSWPNISWKNIPQIEKPDQKSIAPEPTYV